MEFLWGILETISNLLYIIAVIAAIIVGWILSGRWYDKRLSDGYVFLNPTRKRFEYFGFCAALALMIFSVPGGYLSGLVDKHKEESVQSHVNTTSNQKQSVQINQRQPTSNDSISSSQSRDEKTQATNKEPIRNEVKSELMLSGVAIGDTFDSVREKLGNPTKKESKDNGKIYYFYPSMEIHCYGNRVTTLVSESPSARTPKGIHEGSYLQEVLNAYGNNYTKTQYGGLNLYEYQIVANNGQPFILRFACNQQDDRVNYISIRQKE